MASTVDTVYFSTANSFLVVHIASQPVHV